MVPYSLNISRVKIFADFVDSSLIVKIYPRTFPLKLNLWRLGISFNNNGATCLMKRGA